MRDTISVARGKGIREFAQIIAKHIDIADLSQHKINSTINSYTNYGDIESILGWSTSIRFSATDFNTVEWTAGEVFLPSGFSYNVGGSNTGNMAALTYIYFDADISTTDLQITTTASDSVGSNRILIAVAENNTDATSPYAPFQVFGGSGGITLMVDNIAANVASVNEFVSNTAQIKDAIITDLKITGTILVGHTEAKCTDALADQTSVNTAKDIVNLPDTPAGAGLYVDATHLGYYTGAAWGAYIQSDGDFYFGGDATNYVHWDGAALAVRGTLTADDITAGGTITGSKIQTDTGAVGHYARASMDITNNRFTLHDSLNNLVAYIDDGVGGGVGAGFYATDPLGTQYSFLSYDTLTVVNANAADGLIKAQTTAGGAQLFKGINELNATVFLVTSDGNLALSGTVDGVDVSDHDARHENGGADEISVAGLSGVLADAQTPAAHNQSAATITSGTLPIARGGTNNTTYTSQQFLMYDAGDDDIRSSGYIGASFAAAAHVGSGGAAHADVIAAGADGFMTGADKTKLNALNSANYAPVAHVNSTNGHPDATTSAHGFMTDTQFDIIAALGTISTQDSNNVNITGGAINATTIGSATRSSGRFSNIVATTYVNATGEFQHNGTSGIDKTFSFEDSDFNIHNVTIAGGIITSWNVT